MSVEPRMALAQDLIVLRSLAFSAVIQSTGERCFLFAGRSWISRQQQVLITKVYILPIKHTESHGLLLSQEQIPKYLTKQYDTS